MKEDLSMTHHDFVRECIAEARLGLSEGGIPIGAVLVDASGTIIARGRNRRVQDGSVIHHAEMNCIENAGQLPADTYRGATLYSTLSPCYMCSGAAVLLGIAKVVVGENRTVAMGEDFLRGHGVALTVLDDAECFEMLQSYIREHRDVWDGDKGEH